VRGLIVAGNTPDDCNALLPGALDFNLDSDSTCFGPPNAVHGNPRLKPLENNGGPTPTHALRKISPAIDKASGGACPPPGRDQRGVKRPKDIGPGQARCDLGSYELKP
jgi:hypothetical protein